MLTKRPSPQEFLGAARSNALVQAVLATTQGLRMPTHDDIQDVTAKHVVVDVIAALREFGRGTYMPAFARSIATSAQDFITIREHFHDGDLTVTAAFVQGHGCQCSLADLQYTLYTLRAVVPALQEVFQRRPEALTIILALSPHVKVFPSDKAATITAEHVNSGVSLINVDAGVGRTIYIHRREEYLRVLIHELIHCFGADAMTHRVSGIIADMEKSIARGIRVTPTRGQLKLTEAYVDCHAVLAYAVVVASTVAKLKKHGERAERGDLIDEYLLAQRAHVQRVAVRLLQLMGAHFREESHAFAYYVAKAGLVSSPSALSALPRRGIRDEDDFRALARCVLHGLRSLDFRQAISRHADDRNRPSARMSASQTTVD